MLAQIVREEGDKAGSVKGINEACASLNPGDQGQLAEEWLIAHRVEYADDSADNYLTQVFMTQKDNPAMSGNRKPDLGIRENEFGDFEINEVKSGTAALSEKHDIPQIEDMLKATEDGGGTVRKGEKSYEVNDVVVTFTDSRKVERSSDSLNTLLQKYPHLTIEYFDLSGNSIEINRLWLLENKYKTLQEALMALGVS